MDMFSFAIPETVINVIPRCGNDICESGVGETAKTCCRDCECGKDKNYGKDYFCYQGKNPNGECLSISKIDMRIQSIEPDPMKCTILELGGKCVFTQSLRVYPLVLNPPSDLEIIDSYYRIGNSGNYTPLSCYKITGDEGNYSCSLAMESIPDSSLGKETRGIDLKMSMGYTLNGILMTPNLSDQKSFTVSREYSGAVASCLQQQESIDKKLAKLESDRTIYMALAVLFFIISLYFWYTLYNCVHACKATGYAVLPCIASCKLQFEPPALIAGIIGGCGLSFVLSRLSSIESQMKQLQAQKESICSSSSFGGLSGATTGMGNILYMIGQIYGGVVCMMAVMGAIGGLAGAAGHAGAGAAGTMGGAAPAAPVGGFGPPVPGTPPPAAFA